MTFGMIYWLLPRLFQTPLWSQKLAETHFWVGTIGILLYIVAMYAAGLTQGLMWRAFDETGRLAVPRLRRDRRCGSSRCTGCARSAASLYLAGHGPAAASTCCMTWRARPAALRRARASRRRRSRSYADPPDRRVAAQRRRRRRASRDAAQGWWHRRWERLPLTLHGLDRRSPWRRLALRDHPDVPDPLERAHDRLGEAVHAAGAGRPRHLHRRGLLQLPLADDPARSGPRPSATASTASPASSSTTIRSSGARGASARTCARGRQVSARLARPPPREPAVDHAAVDHARVPVAAQRALDFGAIQRRRRTRWRCWACPIRRRGRGRRRRRAQEQAAAIAGEIVEQGGPRTWRTRRSWRWSRTCSGSGTDIKRRRPRRRRPRRRRRPTDAMRLTDIISAVHLAVFAADRRW